MVWQYGTVFRNENFYKIHITSIGLKEIGFLLISEIFHVNFIDSSTKNMVRRFLFNFIYECGFLDTVCLIVGTNRNLKFVLKYFLRIFFSFITNLFIIQTSQTKFIYNFFFIF